VPWLTCGAMPSLSSLDDAQGEDLDQLADIFIERPNSCSKSRQRQADQRRLQQKLAEHGHGSMLRGWRLEMDHDLEFEVDFEDFTKAAGRLSYIGDSHVLFGADDDYSTLTLEELAPFEAQLVRHFKKWVNDRFAGHKEMFSELDPCNDGQVTLDVWCQQLPKLGFKSPTEQMRGLLDGEQPTLQQQKLLQESEAIKTLYHLCDLGDVGNLKQEDLIFLEADPKVRAEEFHKMKVSQMTVWKQAAAREFIEYHALQGTPGTTTKCTHRLAPRPWQAKTFETMPTVICHRNNQRLRDNLRRARHARKKFIQHLKDTYGNEVRAVRKALSPDHGYGFSLMALRNYCRRSNLKIDHRDLWNALDRNNDGIVSLEELAVQSALTLANFQKWARRNPYLGSCAAIWDSPEAASVSRRRSGTWFAGKKMMVGTLQETLKELKYPGINNPQTRNLLFGALDLINCGLVTRADLEWLDKWRPVEWVYSEADPQALQEFKEILVRQYGHPLHAWRVVLDKDNSNSIDYNEFLAACKKIHFKGNPNAAWRAFDVDLVGKVSMKQFDAESAEILNSFKEWTEVNFGSVKHFFKAFDTDDSDSVTLQELKRACHKLHWNGDVALLFECLDVDQKKDQETKVRSLSFEEVAFLDSWHLESTEEELAADSEELSPGPMKKKKPTAASMHASTLRLACPMAAAPLRRKPVSDLDQPTDAGSRPATQSTEMPSRPLSRSMESRPWTRSTEASSRPWSRDMPSRPATRSSEKPSRPRSPDMPLKPFKSPEQQSRELLATFKMLQKDPGMEMSWSSKHFMNSYGTPLFVGDPAGQHFTMDKKGLAHSSAPLLSSSTEGCHGAGLPRLSGFAVPGAVGHYLAGTLPGRLLIGPMPSQG